MQSLPVTIVLLVAIGVSNAQPYDRPLGPSLEQAEALFVEFSYPAAARVYHDLLAADTTNLKILSRLSQSWNLHGLDMIAGAENDSAKAAFETAIKYAEQTLRHHPGSATSYVNLAAAYGDYALLQGGKKKVRLGRAVEEYCYQALAIDSTDVVALTILGIFYRELAKLNWIERFVARTLYGGLPKGTIEQSKYYLERAVSVDSLALFPNYSLAVTLHHMKDKEASQRLLEKVLTLQPRNSEEARFVQNARQGVAK